MSPIDKITSVNSSDQLLIQADNEDIVLPRNLFQSMSHYEDEHNSTTKSTTDNVISITNTKTQILSTQ